MMRLFAVCCVMMTLAAGAVFADGEEDVFHGVLKPENRANWRVPAKAAVEWTERGAVFRGTAEGAVEATYEVAVPAGLRGRPVRQEIDVMSRAKLIWCGAVRVDQLDEKGGTLPEPVSDLRSTNHMRPPMKRTSYRTPGRIHPKAVRLRLAVELKSAKTDYGLHGEPLADRADTLPVLELTHFALVPVEEERIAGLASFAFGSADERSFFYQANSRAVWSQGKQLGDADDRFFPSGDGTLEGWFKPNLGAIPADRKRLAVAIFSGDNGFTTFGQKQGKGEVLGLYRVGTGFRVKLTDWAGHGFSGEAKDVPFPDGEWTHLALTWTCGGTARLWVNGTERLALPIPGFEANPLKDPAQRNKNDLGVTELFVGGNARIVRCNWGTTSGATLFEGEGDDIRVSSGVRYAAAFTPVRGYALDGTTRALFSFDGTYDGVSAGGLGFIPASVQSRAERDGRETGPLRDADDPRKVFDLDNYPVMPSAADYREARVRRTASFDAVPGAVLEVGCAPRAVMDFVEIANAGDRDLAYPIVVRDGELDPRSFGDIADSIRAMGLSDRARVDRVFQYVISASDYFMNWQLTFDPGSDAPRRAWWDALVNLNAYCGFECGPLNNLAANLFATAADCPAAETQGYGHTFEQVFYDGKNRLYDLSAQMFIPKMDNSGPASLEEVEDQPGAFARVGKASDHFIRKTTRHSSPRDVAYAAKAALVLRPGESFRVNAGNDGRFNNLCSYPRKGTWASAGIKFDECDYAEMSGANADSAWVKRIDRPFPHFSTGVIAFDRAPSAAAAAFESAAGESFVYRVTSAYPVVWGEYAAYLKDGSTAPLELSTDLKSFAALPKGTDGVTRLEYRVRARHEYLVRVKAPPGSVARFFARTEVLVNPRTYPGWLKGGANRLTFKAGPGGVAKVTFGWREPAKEIVVKGGAYQGTIPGFERQLVLVDPDRPLELAVEGAGAAATVTAHGPLAATLAGGRLTLAADASKGPLRAHGDDLGYAGPAFPAFAEVEIADGGAVKRLTALVARNARLAVPEGAAADEVQPCVRLTEKDAPATVRFDALPAGTYSVFALTRWASHPQQGRAELWMKDPANPAKAHAVAAWRNGCFDFLKANYGRAGGRANWRWDSAVWGAEKQQKSYCGWSIRTFDLPTFDHLDFNLRHGNPEGTEFAAVLVIPDSDREFRAELRSMLFGLNADPTLARPCSGKSALGAERSIGIDEYRDRMKGAWIGQIAGVCLGAPTEFRWRDAIIPMESLPKWKPEMINDAFNQDDLYVEMTFLRTLEEYGLDVSPRQAGIDFANSEYRLWCANCAGRDNLRKGIAPPASSHPANNACPNDIDYQIEADYAGIISPGCPQEVIRLGNVFGRLMNYGDGVWAGQFIGAMYAEAFFSRDVETILDAGLAAIPAESDYAQMVRNVRAWHREFPNEWTNAWERVCNTYSKRRNKSLRGSNGDIDVRLNGAAVVLGLIYGGGDIDRTIEISMRCGWDSDCNPSSAAGVLGCAMGFSRLDGKYVSHIDNGRKFSFTAYDLPGLYAVCEKLTRAIVVRSGGRIETAADGTDLFVVPVVKPVPDAFVPSWKAPPGGKERFTAEELAKIRIPWTQPSAQH